MAGPKKQRLVAEKRGFRFKPIKHPRYKFVVYLIESGRRVAQAYFQSERAANSHAYTENIRLKNEGSEAQTLGPELRGQAIEATRRLEPYGKTLRDAVDFYEAHLKSEASLRQIKLGAFIKEFLQAKEEKDRQKKAESEAVTRYFFPFLAGFLGAAFFPGFGAGLCASGFASFTSGFAFSAAFALGGSTFAAGADVARAAATTAAAAGLTFFPFGPGFAG